MSVREEIIAFIETGACQLTQDPANAGALLDAYAAEVRKAALEEAADALTLAMGPRAMEHETDRAVNIVTGYYMAVDAILRWASPDGQELAESGRFPTRGK